MKTIKAHCLGCKKTTEHKEVIKIHFGKFGMKHLKGKKYKAGYKCSECNQRWDII